MKKQQITSWTNYPKIEANLSKFSFSKEVENILYNSTSIIARGNGRSYGDASLNQHVVSCLQFNHILEFNTETGIFHCQSGVLLSDILDIIVPKGWFLPVTPGTKFITIGGAIGSNVHGKNHHADGSFSKHVIDFQLLKGNGDVENISERSNPELFNLTCGGMGLTGIILEARIQLKKIETSFITFKSIKARNLDEIFSLFEAYKKHTYSMAWIDCLQTGKAIGRSILMLGEHAKKGECKTQNNLLNSKNKTLFRMPINLPSWLMNRYSISLFNFFYYHKQFSKEVNKIVHYDGFFYPLDSILEWNKMYGKTGFVQYQLVLPMKKSRTGLEEVLGTIAEHGFGSFLGVLKLMGKQDNEISFPIEGYTLALDFPIKKGLFEFLNQLDQIVLKYGGRLYLSKDARMSKEMYWNSYQSIEEIAKSLDNIDPKKKMSSLLASRLGLH